MKISVSGKQISIGDALQEYVIDEVKSRVNKYFPNAVSADIVFSKQRHLFISDVLVNEGTGSHLAVKGKGSAGEIHASFDTAIQRIEKQLRRYKRKITKHHKAQSQQKHTILEATKVVLSWADEESEQSEAPLIVAEKSTKIQSLTVGEAVMIMDLSNLPALMFINRLNQNVNVIYRREDGNISWIDSGVTNNASIKENA